MRIAPNSIRACACLVEERADRVHDLEIGLLVVAPDIVGFADPDAGENMPDRSTMIQHEQPVAHVAALSVDRRWAAAGWACPITASTAPTPPWGWAAW